MVLCHLLTICRDAEELDKRAKDGQKKGILHGEIVLIKDNIDVAGMRTTAGSLALKDNLANQDAPVVTRYVQ